MYLQLVEGPAPAIDALYSKIVIDDRHTDVELVLTNMVSQRLFPRWQMLHDEWPSLLWSPAQIDGGAIEAAHPIELLRAFTRLSESAERQASKS